MDVKKNIKREVEKIEEDIIKWRRDIHRHPELGFEEERTSDLVAKKLNKWGYKVDRVAKTGVVGLLEGNNEKKTIAIRADMDALPLTEKTDVEYCSQNPGKMHACGHDGHTAIALGTAYILSQLKDQINGNVKFLFQPAEEGPGGAKPMIEEGVLQNPEVNAIIGLHIRTDIPLGQIGIAYGPIMAATDEFTIIVKGKGAHGAHPDEGVDPIVVSSHVVLALQELVSRETEPTEPLVITTGSIHGGTTVNIIPDQVKLEGTVRTLNPELRKRIRNRIKETASGISNAMRAEIDFEYRPGYPPTITNPEITGLMEKEITAMLGTEGVYHIEKPSMGGEDFAYFLEEIPGTFVLLGTRNPEKDIIYPGHSPRFNFDESILTTGVELFSRTVLRYFNK